MIKYWDKKRSNPLPEHLRTSRLEQFPKILLKYLECLFLAALILLSLIISTNLSCVLDFFNKNKNEKSLTAVTNYCSSSNYQKTPAFRVAMETR
jgi:hypothetical protein